MNRFITGAAGNGKSTELMSRAREAARERGVLVTSAARASLESLRRSLAGDANITTLALSEIAQRVLRKPLPGTLVDDADATLRFATAAEPLLRLEWTEFLEAQLDPEVPGLRAPTRFLDSAFRLFGRLRDAGISPEKFLQTALQGAASFYAKPPNFSEAALLAYTKEAHRSSLDVDPAELRRQYRREVDLAKILVKLYSTYLEDADRGGYFTARDVIARAAAGIERDPAVAAAFRERYAAIFVDDAQELSPVELQLVTLLYPQDAGGATFAGDHDSALSTFRGARPDMVFTLPGERLRLDGQQRSPAAIDRACRHLAGAAPANSLIAHEQTLTLARGADAGAEASLVARHIAQLLAGGTAPNEIAVIFRSVDRVLAYREALLSYDVPSQVVGDVNIFSDPYALDALAVLWSAYDPFAHEYLLRVLSGPALALADSSLAALCAPPDATGLMLFDVDERGRQHVDRTVLLASNVLGGDRDAALPLPAKQRVQAFRAKRQRWADAIGSSQLCELIQTIWREGLAAEGEPQSVRARVQQQALRRLYRRAQRFEQERDADFAWRLSKVRSREDQQRV